MKGTNRILGALVVLVCVPGCAPELTPPEEAVRVAGRVVPERAEPSERSGSTQRNAANDGTNEAAAGNPEEVETVGSGETDPSQMPVRIAVHERCSPRFLVFEDCPGKQLGEAKIPKPGPFLIDVDTQRKEIVVFAWPEGPGVASATCGAVTTRVDELDEPLEVPLSGSECPQRQPLYY